MGAKSEIGWKRRDADGVRWDVYARAIGHDWVFYRRAKRFENWQPIEQPPLEDWIELLDAVRRRIRRRLLRPEEEARVLDLIRARFPDADP